MKIYLCLDGVRDSIELPDNYDAQDIKESVSEWVEEGEWGDEGGSITVYYGFDEDCEDSVTVEIEPNHEALIRAVMPRHTTFVGPCGLDPESHEWVSTIEVDGGCKENPGVFSGGGTKMVYKSHCFDCGLKRTRIDLGFQKNPGEHDTVEYSFEDEANG